MPRSIKRTPIIKGEDAKRILAKEQYDISKINKTIYQKIGGEMYTEIFGEPYVDKFKVDGLDFDTWYNNIFNMSMLKEINC